MSRTPSLAPLFVPILPICSSVRAPCLSSARLCLLLCSEAYTQGPPATCYGIFSEQTVEHNINSRLVLILAGEHLILTDEGKILIAFLPLTKVFLTALQQGLQRRHLIIRYSAKAIEFSTSFYFIKTWLSEVQICILCSLRKYISMTSLQSIKCESSAGFRE